MLLNKKQLLVLILFFSLAFNIAFAGIYAYKLMSDESPPGQRRSEISRRDRTASPRWGRLGELDLSEEQRKEIAPKREQVKRNLREKRESAQEIREEFITLFEDPDADLEEISRAINQFHELHHQMRLEISEDLLQLHKILNKEQRRKLGRFMMGRYTQSTPGKRKNDL